MGAIEDLYEALSDFAEKANLPNEIANLRARLEQLDEEHAQELGQLEQEITDLQGLVRHQQQRIEEYERKSPESPQIPDEKSKPTAASERVDKDDLPLDAQGW